MMYKAFCLYYFMLAMIVRLPCFANNQAFTANSAAMESNGVPNKIHVYQRTVAPCYVFKQKRDLGDPKTRSLLFAEPMQDDLSGFGVTPK